LLQGGAAAEDLQRYQATELERVINRSLTRSAHAGTNPVSKVQSREVPRVQCPVAADKNTERNSEGNYHYHSFYLMGSNQKGNEKD
jgi:hypothetical protein